MTTHSSPISHAALTDLPARERREVLDLFDRLDFDDLAGAAGMSRTRLLGLPQLSSKRGRFRTPYPLLCAVTGYGHPGGPATTLGQILRRLGFTVNANTGTIDKDNYNRAREAADFFGIALPEVAKDGPASGQSLRHDVAVFTAAWHSSSTLTELATALKQKPSGGTNDRNVTRGAELGLPDKFSTTARAQARMDKATGLQAERAARAAQPKGPTLGELEQAHAEHARRERAITGCLHCGARLPQIAAQGGPSWKAYCNDQCRFDYHEAQRQQENRAKKASAQQPCEVCGAHITPGARTKTMCSPACRKRAAYLRKRRTAVAPA